MFSVFHSHFDYLDNNLFNDRCFKLRIKDYKKDYYHGDII